MNKTKLRRLQGDLNLDLDARRSLSDQYLDAKEDHSRLSIGIRKTYLGSQYKLPGFTDGDDLALLLKCEREDLRIKGIDRRDVEHLLELREQMADLQARVEALTAKITPQIQLVDALNKHVESHNHG